jgi:hypothetical protein
MNLKKPQINLKIDVAKVLDLNPINGPASARGQRQGLLLSYMDEKMI